MAASIRLNDLAAMTAAEKTEALDALVAAARSGDHGVSRAMLDARIRRFEERYEIGSNEMLRRLGTGEMKETAELSEWLFLLDSRRAGVAR